MKDLQEVFNDLQLAKKESKEIRKEYRDSLSQNTGYQEIVEKMTEMRELKKKLELAVQRDMGTRWEKLEDLKSEIKAMQEMISDISVTNLVDGKSVEVRDEYDSLYEPIYTVSFKKAD
jgi:uncharacterized membrane protein